MSTEIIPNGALVDTRPLKEKEKDYNAKEIAGAHHAVPFKHSKITELTKTVYSQEYTSSCVAHAFLTQMEYEGLVKPKPKGYSQLLTYRKRKNYPSPGCIAADIYERIAEGQCANSVAPVTVGYTEKLANELPYIIGSKTMPLFTYFSITDYSSIPDVVTSNKAVVVFIYASKDEYSREYVTVREPNLQIRDAYVSHAICLVPSGDFTENGVEWLAVHDSAKFGGLHLRYIDKNFLLKRCFYASKIYNSNTMPTPEPPVTAIANVACQFKDESNAVRNLQGMLIQQGYLESQYQTGYFGALTAKALLEWQLVHYKEFNYMRPVRELLSLEGKFFGQQSIDIVENNI